MRLDDVRSILLEILLATVGVVAAAGCSTYGGEKLGNKATGIPYALARPEFTLTRTPPAEGQRAPTYTLAVSYEPDPRHVYTVNVKPAIFTDPDFTVKLGSGGTMTGTKAGFTEQITPTITAIGSFVSNLVGALGKAAFDEASIRSQITGTIDAEATKSDSVCKRDSTVPFYGAPKPDKPPADGGPRLTVSAELKRRIDAFRNDATFAELFHYVNLDERACLGAALTTLTAFVKSIHETNVDRYRKERAAHAEAFANDVLFLERMDRAVANDDSAAFAAMAATIVEDKGKGGEAKTRAESRDKVLTAGRRAAQSTAASNGNRILASIVDPDPAVWRARHVLYLERAIDASALAAIRQPGAADAFAADIQTLRDQRAAALGVAELYARVKLLGKFLESIRERPDAGGGRGPATAEFATARAEFDEALKQIDARRTRVLTDAKPAQPTVPAIGPARVVVVDRSYIKSAEGKGKENYVIVLEEIK